MSLILTERRKLGFLSLLCGPHHEGRKQRTGLEHQKLREGCGGEQEWVGNLVSRPVGEPRKRSWDADPWRDPRDPG